MGRLAPSPTGPLHVGHARTFLLAWWAARAKGGQVVLRLEDLDPERCRPEYDAWVREDLQWLGLDWDSESRQSERAAQIAALADTLIRDGLAFPCVCSRSDLRTAVAAPHGPPVAGYPGTCRGLYASVADALAKTGKAAAIRFHGRGLTAGPSDRFTGAPFFPSGPDDFVIVRRDGIPAYHLAVVVDDGSSNVTEIVRGDDLLASTPLHLELYGALSLPPPEYFHIPLVVNEFGQRLAKREAGLSLRELRSAGVRPDQVVAWVAQSAGMQALRGASAAHYIAAFRMADVPRHAVALPVAGFANMG